MMTNVCPMAAAAPPPSPQPPPPRPPPPLPPLQLIYVPDAGGGGGSGGIGYLLEPRPATFEQALAACGALPQGSLVRLTSRALQQRVEGFYSSRGTFGIAGVSFYWTALVVESPREWPAFGWLGDRALNAWDYTHWGMYK
jgi:hypothetical protein